MGIEIDLLQVGDADAIALRHVNEGGNEFVAVIDGGYEEHGKQLVKHINTHYHRSHVDLVVSSHPDDDHVSGLRALLELIDVRRVWVHDPSRHPQSSTLSATKTRAARSLQTTAIMKSLDNVSYFIAAVDARNIPREEPFAGTRCGPLMVLGPSQGFYEQLLNEIAADEGFAKSMRVEESPETRTEAFLEQYSNYAIDENNETAPSNNTSTIIWVKDADRQYLFTADAGVQALESARGTYSFPRLHWLQVPHHGSRRNLSSALVDYLKPSVAYVSAQGNIKHPSRAVVNALKRVDTSVYSTHKAGSLWHHAGAGVPDSRESYSAAQPL